MILLGNLIVLAPLLLNAHASARYGIPFPVPVRASFGIYGLRLVWHTDVDRRSGDRRNAARRLARLDARTRRPMDVFLVVLDAEHGGRLPRDRHRALPAGPRGAVGRGGRGTAALTGCVQSGRIRTGHACVEPLHCPLQVLELLRALGDGHSRILGDGRLERVALRPIPQSGYTGLLRAISTAVN